jgi:citrate synthase
MATRTARISSAEAAARLGVKRETLYAYVSRGVLQSELAPSGKGSTFDPAEVERLRQRRRRPARAADLDAPILSSVTEVADHRIRYRRHDLADLVHAGVPFEAVAELLWTGHLDESVRWPVDEGVAARHARAQRALPPSAPLLDRIRLAVVVASSLDELRDADQPAAIARTAARLAAAVVDGLGDHARAAAGAATTGRRRTPALVAHRLWPGLGGTGSARRWGTALDVALVCLADHDLATSTFAARVAASVRADPYSVVLTGLGAIGGRLHGAASRPVHALLEAAARDGATVAVGAMLREPRREHTLAGFGHGLYPKGDPRVALVLDALRDAGASLAVERQIATVIEDRIGLLPNVDFAVAALTRHARLRPDAGEALFAIARTAGWVAHAVEELDEAPLRFRPRGRYVPPPQDGS